MSIDGWRYYNHAVIPTTAPHEEPDLTPIKSGLVWTNIKGKGTPLLARWHTDWDCSNETQWWYCIKDTPFDITILKSKRRYEINKGNKNFEVKEINPPEYGEDLFRITEAAYETYPASYRPVIDHDSFVKGTAQWNYYKTYGAFEIENNRLCGYAFLLKDDSYINFAVLKTLPDKEKMALNAAIVYKILADHEAFLSSGGYICDGARSIQHETAFQDYLEKYFEFRKAYCKLHIVYKPSIKVLINLAYPLRRILRKMNSINVIRKLNALLCMEEINRTK